MLDLNIKTDTTGFVSPAEIYVDKRLDLNDLIIKNVHSTFFFRYMGENVDIVKKGNILVIDKSEKINKDDLIVLYSENNFKLERYNQQVNIFGKVAWILNEL